METLATIEELAARMSFVMNDDDQREAEGALDDLSDDARLYGSELWETAASTPRSVRNLILKAASRHMKNYEGFLQSRAGDEAVTWTDRGEDAGSAYFTEREQKALRQTAGGSTLHTVGVYAWNNKPATSLIGYIPTPQGSPFPLFANVDEPW